MTLAHKISDLQFLVSSWGLHNATTPTPFVPTVYYVTAQTIQFIVKKFWLCDIQGSQSGVDEASSLLGC